MNAEKLFEALRRKDFDGIAPLQRGASAIETIQQMMDALVECQKVMEMMVDPDVMKEMKAWAGAVVVDQRMRGAIQALASVRIARKGCAALINGPTDLDISKFRKKMIAALNELPGQMTVGEIIGLMYEVRR